jgi:hypothetical protein
MIYRAGCDDVEGSLTAYSDNALIRKEHANQSSVIYGLYLLRLTGSA